VTEHERDPIYRECLLRPIRVCTGYVPKMGKGTPTDLAGFRSLYGADPLYSWLGLDSPLRYAAPKVAGGMTSLYRQVGIGCEELWRRLLMDELGLSLEEATWSYETPAASGKAKRLKLDGRIDRSSVRDPAARDRVEDWLQRARASIDIEIDIKGVVFEVRQGYKSKDSKRQNADIDNASHALKHAYVPAAVVLSLQMDSDISLRYRQNNWVVLLGNTNTEDDLQSCYAFAQKVVGYDLVGFFERNTALLREEIEGILRGLLEPS
jgi:hypothetical protein